MDFSLGGPLGDTPFESLFEGLQESGNALLPESLSILNDSAQNVNAIHQESNPSTIQGDMPSSQLFLPNNTTLLANEPSQMRRIKSEGLLREHKGATGGPSRKRVRRTNDKMETFVERPGVPRTEVGLLKTDYVKKSPPYMPQHQRQEYD